MLCSGLGADLDDASRFPHFPKIVLRISDKSPIWFFFFLFFVFLSTKILSFTNCVSK